MKYYRNCELAFLGELETILTSGKDIDSRNGKCKEVLQKAFTIQYPMERCLFLKGRNDNVFHKIAETLWVLAGRNDMDFLEYYLPRCREWSDSGDVWRAGYGPRLRLYYGEHESKFVCIDQLAQCIKLLNDDNNTRRAVISLWDPASDYRDSKDIPCNVALNFIIRDGKLHLSIFQRSSDIWWGLSGINMFEWSVLMQMMAYWTHAEVGQMAYFITSLHLYEPIFKRAEHCLRDNLRWIYRDTEYQRIPLSPKFSTDFECIDKELDNIFRIEYAMRDGVEVRQDIADIKDNFLRACAQMMYVYHLYNIRSGLVNYTAARIYIDSMEPSDLKEAAVEYLDRKT